MRAQEMARYVENGVLDAGLTGLDWILENDADVEIVTDLIYSKASTTQGALGPRLPRLLAHQHAWRTARGRPSPRSWSGSPGGTSRSANIPVKVEFSWGATEAKAVDGLVDAIVEVTETGTTLRANGLKIVHTLLETNTKLIANRAAMKDPAKKRKIQHIALLLRGALAAENMVGLKMNVPEASFDEVDRAPAQPHLAHRGAPARHGVVLRGDRRSSESVVRELVPRLIEKGADGIIEYPLNKVVNRSDAT